MKEKRNPTKLEREIASRLKDLRLKKNMTAKKVAELVGVSAMTMSRYENAEIVNIPIDNIYKLSEIYNTTITYILSGINELNKNKLIKQITEQLDKLNEEQLNKINEMIKIIIK